MLEIYISFHLITEIPINWQLITRIDAEIQCIHCRSEYYLGIQIHVLV